MYYINHDYEVYSTYITSESEARESLSTVNIRYVGLAQLKWFAMPSSPNYGKLYIM